MRFADLAVVLGTMAVPMVLLLVVALVQLGLRRRFERAMRRVGEGADGADAPGSLRRPGDVPLPLRWLRPQDTPALHGSAAAAHGQAEAARRASDRAFAIAGSLLGVLLCAIAAAGWARGSLPDRLIFAHVFGVAPLFVTLAFVSSSWPRRLAIVAGYLLAGLAVLAPMAGGWGRTLTVAAIWSPLVLLILPCLLLLTIRRLRPLLLLLAALFVFMALITLAWVPVLLWLDPTVPRSQVLDQVTGQPGWVWAVGTASFLLGGVLLQQLLSRVHSPRTRAALLGLAALITAAGIGLVAGPLGAHPATALLLAATVVAPMASMLQWFVVWLIFRLLLAIQASRWVTPRVLHFHVCCAALAVFVAAPLRSAQQDIAALLCLAAFGVELLVLHLLLRRAWSRMPPAAPRRLLLLRVFGQADRRETLLDGLDHGWRHVGRVDLIAGTDLALRTLGSRMLEALLLRRADSQYLQTADDVRRRLGRLHDVLEGDLHYPVNEVYCYENTWKAAVGRLAVDAHAVLMDLRGFSSDNLGCVFELEFLSREVSADRVLLLADATTDAQAVAQTLHRRPDATPAGAAIAIMGMARDSSAARDALNRELYRIAFDACAGASFVSR